MQATMQIHDDGATTRACSPVVRLQLAACAVQQIAMRRLQGYDVAQGGGRMWLPSQQQAELLLRAQSMARGAQAGCWFQRIRTPASSHRRTHLGAVVPAAAALAAVRALDADRHLSHPLDQHRLSAALRRAHQHHLDIDNMLSDVDPTDGPNDGAGRCR